MSKLLFTRLLGKTAAVLIERGRVSRIEFEPDDPSSELGCIYIGKVKNIVKNINAAFVEYRKGVNGYYSLTENKRHLFTDQLAGGAVLEESGPGEGGAVPAESGPGKGGAVPAENGAEGVFPGGRPLREGDEIIVQVARAAVKTKDATLTAALELTGQFAVLTAGNRGLGFSKKIRNEAWKQAVKEEWDQSCKMGKKTAPYGLIVRTNAEHVSAGELWRETSALMRQYEALLSEAPFRTCYSLVYRPPGFALSVVRDIRMDSLEEIVTDLPELYGEIGAFLEESRLGKQIKLRLYEDDALALESLYRLSSALAEATGKRVWLKSGGYLVIEPTEAMTVIDVNTGKNAGKKDFISTVYQTNLEAAAEIAFQLRLRNLSGIIIVDFIDVEQETEKENLLKALRRETALDPVRTSVVDMTPLGLVEITRKKIKKPLHEQIERNG